MVRIEFQKERIIYLAIFFGFLVLSTMLAVIALLIINIKDNNNNQEKENSKQK